MTGKVSRTRVVSLEQPADTVVAYWRGNPHADVRLAFSLDGTTFGRAEPAGRDEIGTARRDGTTYGALHSTKGAVAVRVTTDRPVARLTVLGLSDGRRHPDDDPAQLDRPVVCCRCGHDRADGALPGAPGVQTRRT